MLEKHTQQQGLRTLNGFVFLCVAFNCYTVGWKRSERQC